MAKLSVHKNTADITTDNDTYLPYNDVNVSWEYGKHVRRRNDWITIYPADASDLSGRPSAWLEPNGRIETDVFRAYQLDYGDYKAHLMRHDKAHTVLASSNSFTIEATVPTSTIISNVSDRNVVIAWAYAAGDVQPGDWIGLYKASTKKLDSSAVAWAYASDRRYIAFGRKKLGRGKYKAYIIRDGKKPPYTAVASSKPFIVKSTLDAHIPVSLAQVEDN